MIANRLRYLWTATYEREPVSLAELTADLETFRRKLQRKHPRVAMLAVWELGSLGGRIHIHFAVPDFLSWELVQASWGKGHVWVVDPRTLSGRTTPRNMARYLSKYLVKDLVDEEGEVHPFDQLGAHRYWVTQGHQPKVVRERYRSYEEAFARLTALIGQAVASVPFGDHDHGDVYGWWYCSIDEPPVRARSRAP